MQSMIQILHPKSKIFACLLLSKPKLVTHNFTYRQSYEYQPNIYLENLLQAFERSNTL